MYGGGGLGMVRSEGTGDDEGGKKETVFFILRLLSLATLLTAALAYIIKLFHIPSTDDSALENRASLLLLLPLDNSSSRSLVS